MPDTSQTYCVAWKAPSSYHAIDSIQSLLSPYGLSANISDAITGGEDMALLHVGSYTSLAELMADYEAISRPTLVVVNDHEQEIEMLKVLQSGDDVCLALMTGHKKKPAGSNGIDLQSNGLPGPSAQQ